MIDQVLGNWGIVPARLLGRPAMNHHANPATTIVSAIRPAPLVPVLEAFNPGDVEQIHAVFVGGVSMPARVRFFVDFIAAHLR